MKAATATAREDQLDHPTTLVLGLGNDLITDDGFGPAVARAAEPRLRGRPGVSVVEASVAGFNLLDLLNGFDRVLIVDVAQTGRAQPGSLCFVPLEQASAGRTLGGSHQMDLPTTLSFGRTIGYRLSDTVSILMVEGQDLMTIQEKLSPAVEAAVPEAVELVCRWVAGECK
jgi:hydrogenase maturation protease